MNTWQIYDRAKTINCELGNNIVIGEDSFLKDCVIENYVQINRRNIFENVKCGERTYTGSNTVLKHVKVGKYCAISWNVSATGNTHDYKKASSHPFAQLKSFGLAEQNDSLDPKVIKIGNDVWIGANVCILPGITIGDGAVIGAGGVITNDVPPYAIVVGNPGRIIKYRFDTEIRNLLLRAEWWNWTDQIIKDNIELFQEELSAEIAKRMVSISEGVHIDGK